MPIESPFPPPTNPFDDPEKKDLPKDDIPKDDTTYPVKDDAYPAPTGEPVDATPDASKETSLAGGDVVKEDISKVLPGATPDENEKRANLARVREILAEYKNIESDIPVTHEYWKLKDRT